ncbi:inositol hexakisphosphate and diphosphoinositol-pentakisphosphate kinase 2-like isoform X2 [Montipora foliosa]|uniref:inositol hexakisphosphate and diphosphoinositol-pentakisphosphate kinase 2-like isoform X2 n=1 Tax=Montipora foliosa TaxID=591990 RepID=UPI0035F18CE7
MSVTHLELVEEMDEQPMPFSRFNFGDDYDDDDDEDGVPKIRIGICAMSKKTNSQPMHEILGRMSVFDCLDIFVFPDDTILNVPVEDWPICDCLISFYSKGFPLEKAIEYVKLRKPFNLNDLEMQYALMDRPTMYSLLASAGIDTPRHAILLRDENGEPINTKFVEFDDSVQIGDVIFQKPFVEKPVNAEDHNIYIYYPSSAGGGSQRLFRKVGNRSSVYSAESSVRKEGSYIYEDFVVTDGTDVKVYTVGPEYAHAEARKSPSLDGKVERDFQGKEIRYPVILNQYEKELANKVCKLFKQTVCGCDLLRTHGKSYVCDVNGFSFVKTSKKYYDDAAEVLVGLVVQELAPQLYKPFYLDIQEEIPAVEALEGTMLELRCVVGIIRHGDRTPKQKMKMEVRHPRFIELFKKYGGFDEHKLKLKRPAQLQEVLDIARDLLAQFKEGEPVFESRNKIHQLKSVLEMYGYFSGINRKIQFKYLGKPREGNDSESSCGDHHTADSGSDEKSGKKKVQGKDTKEVKTKQHENEHESEAKKNESKDEKHRESVSSEGKEKEKEKEKEPADTEHSLLLIAKWGGELTTMGKEQALELGRAFRSIYPGGHGQYSKFSGCGLLRLHSTYRHDLKIYASDEGRVQMTAAAFAKGFLALEGELTPILVHLVRSDKNTTEMLDTSSDAAKTLGKVKHRLHEMLHSSKDFEEEDFVKLAPTKSRSVINAMKSVKNPHSMCERLYDLVQNLTGQLKELIAQKIYDQRDPFLYHDETLELMTHRWTKLQKDFKLKNGQFDISLIPDIYDCIKYDVQHNSQLGLQNSLELYKCAKAFADIVIPQEYGITQDEKLGIAQRVCVRLLRKIRGDLRHADKSDIHTRLNPNYSQSVETPHRHVRTRLYFTSESHVHTVLNAFRYGKLFEVVPDDQWQRAVDFLEEVPELNYMTQIVLMLFEDPKADPSSEKRFHVEIHFSPGAKTIDDPEFLARSSPTRKRSHEDISQLSSSADVTEPGHERKCSKIGDVGKSGTSVEHTQCFVTTTNSLNSEIKHSHPVEESKESTRVTIHVETPSLRAVLREEEEIQSKRSDLEPDNDKPFDETVYAGNELPRCAIGIENFSDTALGTSTGESDPSSGTSIEESSGEERVLTRQRNCLSESDLQCGVMGDGGASGSTRGERSAKSESDIPTFTAAGEEILQEYQKASPVPCIVEQDESEPRVSYARPKSFTFSGSSPANYTVPASTSSESPEDLTPQKFPKDIKKPSSAKSDTTSVRPRLVSFDLVNKQRCSGEDAGQPLRIVQSTPALKKGSPTRKLSYGSATSAIRAVRNLSLAIQNTLVVRPHPISKSSKNSRKPPIADFYEEITKVESINPLRTLHNSMPLKEMDSFFDRTAGQSTEDLVTPVNTPSRKPVSKKLKASSRATNPTQLTEKLYSAGSEDIDGITELLNEVVEKRDT